MIVNFRNTGINLSGRIQGVVMKEKIHFVCLKKECLKDKVKPAHWVGQSKIISLDTDDLFKRTPNFDEKQAIVTVNTVKLSVYRGEKNSILLQEEEENVAEETNYDADVNAEANEINDKNKDMVVTI